MTTTASSGARFIRRIDLHQRSLCDLLAKGILTAVPPAAAANGRLHRTPEEPFCLCEHVIKRVSIRLTDDEHIDVNGCAAAFARVPSGPRSEDEGTFDTWHAVEGVTNEVPWPERSQEQLSQGGCEHAGGLSAHQASAANATGAHHAGLFSPLDLALRRRHGAASTVCELRQRPFGLGIEQHQSEDLRVDSRAQEGQERGWTLFHILQTILRDTQACQVSSSYLTLDIGR